MRSAVSIQKAPERISHEACAKYCEEKVGKRFGLRWNDVVVVIGESEDSLKKERALGKIPLSGDKRGIYDYMSVFRYWQCS